MSSAWRASLTRPTCTLSAEDEGIRVPSGGRNASGLPTERVSFFIGSPSMLRNTQSEWLTAKEAAQHLRIKPRTLLQWVRQGKVKAFVLSGTKRRVWRFRQADLDAALVELPVLPCPTPSVRPAERMER